MPRPRHDNGEQAGSDSFLDIVANMVGILIILVMVVGVRAKNAPVAASIVDEAARKETRLLEEAQAEEQRLRSDIFEIAERAKTLEREAANRNKQRVLLATTAAALKHELEAKREKIDAEARAAFDLQRGISEAKRRLDDLSRQREQIEGESKAVDVVESLPTPLSQTVDGHELHFRLKDGRIAYVPIDDLVERLKADAQNQAFKLLTRSEFTDTVGPVEGFRMRYTMRRETASLQAQRSGARGGTYARLKLWTVIPVSNDLGETVEQALSERSQFRRILAGFRPERSTVTIWTYEDSFDDFRAIKKELFKLGFATAGRPLPNGIPISGAPDGSRSAAQ